MYILGKRFLTVYAIYILSLIGFFFYQILQINIHGINLIPSSIYALDLDVDSIISVKTEPIYFMIASTLKGIGLPSYIILLIISQAIYASILYLFLKIGETFSKSQQIALMFMASVSFILISMSEAVIRQGIGFIFFTMFLFSNQKHKFIYLFLAVLSHNVFGLFWAAFMIVEKIYLDSSKRFIGLFLLFVFCYFAKDFLFWLAILTSRESYIHYYINSNHLIRFDFFIVMILFNMISVIVNLYINNQNIKLISEKFIILGLSSIALQFAFIGIPYVERLIMIPLAYVPIIIIIFSKPKFLLYLSSFIWAAINLVYLSL